MIRPRVVATSTATLIAAASLSPMAAQAAGQNTIFVNSASSACTDSGTGTLAAPYCTLQVAADAANPGDLVSVAYGNYAATTITRSGTASAPITFTGNGILWLFGVERAASAQLDISGASHVKIVNFRIAPTTAAGAVVDGGSDITFDHDQIVGSAAGPTLHVTNGSSAVSVQRSLVNGAILVDGGSTGTVVTTNRTQAVSVVGAANTAITGNTISGCGPLVSVTGSATGTSVENNVITTPESATDSTSCSASAQAYGVLVDSASASGTTADYNDAYAPNANSAAYNWSGTTYATAAALDTATGQAQHDLNSLLGTQVVEGSPLINSANSAAPGELSTDFNGNPRVLDPRVTPTGAGPYDYYDRGATQFQDPIAMVTNSITASASKAPVGGTITLHAVVRDTWSDAFDYQFKLNNGTTVDGGTSGTANVSFSAPGSDVAYVYVIPKNGAPAPTSYVNYAVITVVPQASLVPQIPVSANGALGVAASDMGTADSWNITGVTFNFGDGTATQTVSDGVQAQHTYAKPGTYSITETVTDAGGNTATTSTKFSTTALPAGTLVNVVSGTTAATPAGGATGVIQSAVTSMPDNSSQLVAATTGGNVEFATGTKDGYAWQSWQTRSLPTGVTAKWVGIAGTPNGSSQLIAISSTGQLWHTIRNANGTWQNGWGSPAGSSGFARASITAMPDGSSQLVAVTTSGVLMHNIRNANGSWQGWHALSQPGVKIVDASIAGLPDGSSQILEVTSAGVMKHDIRFASGAWQAHGWGIPGGFGSVKQVSISSTSVFGSKFGAGTTVMSVVNSAGAIVDAFRNPDGSWDLWYGGTPQVESWGNVANNTITTQPDGSYVTLGVVGG